MGNSFSKREIGLRGLVTIVAAMTTIPAGAATVVHLSLKNHQFVPAEISAPSNTPITIELNNLDSTPAEFESKTLRVEKRVTGGGKISIWIHPLNPGRYRFYDDFHQDTTEGFLVAR
ncbi:MAG: cupredoxin domain-containing protein [Beijerinckiaceae bacterium]|nr:MAG: cupredoxin domain-containing protein [Beijerinckiaceae bacterium]